MAVLYLIDPPHGQNVPVTELALEYARRKHVIEWKRSNPYLRSLYRNMRFLPFQSQTLLTPFLFLVVQERVSFDRRYVELEFAYVAIALQTKSP